MLMAALQKGHFGKGHLKKRNPAREEDKETQVEERKRTQRTVKEQIKLKKISAVRMKES